MADDTVNAPAPSPFSPDNMRARFATLGKQRDAILAQTQGLRAERDALVNLNAARIRDLEKQVAEIEAPLFDLDNERGLLARALGGKTTVISSD